MKVDVSKPTSLDLSKGSDDLKKKFGFVLYCAAVDRVKPPKTKTSGKQRPPDHVLDTVEEKGGRFGLGGKNSDVRKNYGGTFQGKDEEEGGDEGPDYDEGGDTANREGGTDSGATGGGVDGGDEEDKAPAYRPKGVLGWEQAGRYQYPFFGFFRPSEDGEDS